MSKKFIVAAAFAAAAFTPAQAVAGPVLTETIVDSRASTITRGNITLQAGVSYDLVVSGTFSSYGQDLWNQPADAYIKTCGTTAPITFKSPSAADVNPVGGQDSEFLFAGIAFRGCGNFIPPIAGGHLEISTDGDDGLLNLTPVGGPTSAPASNHTYTYRVTGQGKVPRFLILDNTRSDNNGRLKVKISES